MSGGTSGALVFPADEWELVRSLHLLMAGDPPALPEPGDSTGVRKSSAGLAARAECHSLRLA